MKLIKQIFILAAAITSCTLSYGQDRCENLIVKYSDGKETPGTKWLITIEGAAGGKLVYYGARHADDPKDAQFSEIRSLWETTGPTIAYFEGPNRGSEDTDTATIRKFGESGYVRFLAKEGGVKVFSLEPPPLDLYKHLASRYSQEQVDTYFLLNEAMRLHTRKGYDKQQIEKDLEVMISKLTALLGNKPAINSIADLERAYNKYWHNNGQWWQVPQDWFDPNKTSKETGGVFTNDINKLSSDFRDIYMYRLLAEKVNMGERVFAVIGRNHVPMQEAALRCAVK